MRLLLPFQIHPQRRLRPTWNLAQVSLLLLPILPIWSMVAMLFALIFGWRHQYQMIISRPLNWGFAILSLWLIFTSCLAYKPLEAWGGLINFLPFFVFFAIFSELIQTTAQLWRMAWLIVLPGAIAIVLGFGQMFGNWSGPQLLQGILAWNLVPGGNPSGRMSANFMYANIFAIYLLVVFILALGLAIAEWEQIKPLRGKWQIPNASAIWRLGFLLLLIPSSATAIVLTSSRNAWAIALLACLGFALYQLWYWLLAAVAAFASSVLFAAFGDRPIQQWLRRYIPSYFWARITDELYPDRIPAALRTTQWQFAWSMTQQRPLTGWGLRNFTPLYEASTNFWLGHPHNLLLMLTAETGIIGTLLLCSLVGWVMFQTVLLLAQKSLLKPLDKLLVFSYLTAFIACIIFNFVDVSLFEIRVNLPGWWLLVAMNGLVYHQRSVGFSLKYN